MLKQIRHHELGYSTSIRKISRRLHVALPDAAFLNPCCGPDYDDSTPPFSDNENEINQRTPPI